MKREQKERIEIRMGSDSHNEAFARAVTAAFLTRLDPTVEETEDIKTAVSEAVSNAVLHGYDGGAGEILLILEADGAEITVQIVDRGIGIADVAKAREPLYTTKPTEDRSGMGFYFMEAFMETVEVESEPGKGTTVTMKKTIGRR